jgi:hypothetical protein
MAPSRCAMPADRILVLPYLHFTRSAKIGGDENELPDHCARSFAAYRLDLAGCGPEPAAAPAGTANTRGSQSGAAIALSSLQLLVRDTAPAERYGFIPGAALLVGEGLSRIAGAWVFFALTAGLGCAVAGPLGHASLEVREIVADLLQGEAEREESLDLFDGKISC